MNTHVAADNGYPDVANLLIQNGASLGKRYGLDRTALHLAANSNQVYAVMIQPKTKASVKTQNDVGRTPLIVAASEGHDDVVDLLTQNGADIDIRDGHEGCTALHLAACHNWSPVVQ